MNKENIEKQFINELTDLLGKWGAEIEASDHFPGYPGAGQDIRMIVEIPGLYDEQFNTTRERCEIDLGSVFPR